MQEVVVLVGRGLTLPVCVCLSLGRGLTLPVCVPVAGTGSVEPIPLSVRPSREGLGQETERKRKAAEQRAMRVAMARKRQRHEAEWRENVRSKAASREVDKDLAQSQKVCEQLDSQAVNTYAAV